MRPIASIRRIRASSAGPGRDRKHGGYCWSVDDDGFKDDSKQAYGHAFVMLAAADATMIGHPLGKQMLADVTDVINTRFWDDYYGAVSEEYARNWAKISTYRGQNSNMHLTEALMAAFEVTADRTYLGMAERIASLIINCHARAEGWRVAEHFGLGSGAREVVAEKAESPGREHAGDCQPVEEAGGRRGQRPDG